MENIKPDYRGFAQAAEAMKQLSLAFMGAIDLRLESLAAQNEAIRRTPPTDDPSRNPRYATYWLLRGWLV